MMAPIWKKAIASIVLALVTVVIAALMGWGLAPVIFGGVSYMVYDLVSDSLKSPKEKP